MKTLARRAAISVISVALLCLAACSSGNSNADPSTSASTSSSAPSVTTQPRPSGPAADLSTALTGGNGMYMGEATTPDLDAVGYVEHEYAAAGTATSYEADGALGHDGRWKYVPDATAPYRTRVVVRAPAKAAAFSGTVVVEWLNVSGGVDANPEWVSLHEEMERAGDAWVGVSTQRIGVEGGPVLVKVEGVAGAEDQGKGLKTIDPARYGTLVQPGDGFSFDIFTQTARALRAGAGLNGLQPKRLIAAGESQSAFALVSYHNGVEPLTHAFDGYFVHSRSASGLPIVASGKTAGISDAIGGKSTIFRDDQDAPVLDVQTETDVTSVLNSYAARQPDSDRFRLWEVTGTAHADAHLVGPSAKDIHCGVPINNGAMHIVAKAALRALTAWVESGKAPVTAPRIDVAPGAAVQIRRDADGIALGGIRTPLVDVPVATLSGVPGPTPSTICLLLGSTTPFSAARIAQLYPSRAEYEQRYAAAADATIKAGFALPRRSRRPDRVQRTHPHPELRPNRGDAMTSLHDRPNTALLVVDVQNDVVGNAYRRDEVVASISRVIDRARAQQVPVVWVQHSDENVVEGTDGWQYVPELRREDSEPLVHKHHADAFEDTTLEAELARQRVGRVVVIGAQTDNCIRGTLHGAFARGYDTVLVADAHTTEDFTDYGLPPADKVIAHTNMYWTWQTGPGRTAAVIESDDVDFKEPGKPRG